MDKSIDCDYSEVIEYDFYVVGFYYVILSFFNCNVFWRKFSVLFDYWYLLDSIFEFFVRCFKVW